MNPSIAERFRQKGTEWDFNTIVGGKVVSSAELEQARQQAVKEELERIEVLKKAEVETRVILPAEELTEILQKEYQTTQPEQQFVGEVGIFKGLEDFNRWYLPRREEFSEPQRMALNNLLNIEILVEQGCPCYKENRRGQAHAYYQNFFVENRETDLVESIKRVGAFQFVRFFSIGSDIPFLEG